MRTVATISIKICEPTHSDCVCSCPRRSGLMGPFTVEVPLSGHWTQGLFAFDLGVYHDFLLFGQ